MRFRFVLLAVAVLALSADCSSGTTEAAEARSTPEESKTRLGISSMMAVSNGVEAYEGDGGHAEFSSDVQLAILFNGEFDMWDLVEKGSLIDAMDAFFGGSPKELPKRYDEASPIQRLTKDTPPMLFLHGDLDRCVSHEQALAMVRRLTELNVPAEVEVYKGKPHAWFNKDPDWRITIERVEPFLKKHFQLK